MQYIIKTLDLLQKLKVKLNITTDPMDIYYSIVHQLYQGTDIELAEIRIDIEGYLTQLDIQHMRFNIARMFNPNTPTEEFTEDYLAGMTLQMLSDSQLVKYLGFVLRTIAWVQKDNCLLLKYSKNIWNTGWHNLALECRGKVIDVHTHEIVSYPFNKFFNLYEVPCTKLERVQGLLKDATEVTVTDKKDGSAVILTNHKGKLCINTNGSFDNIQIDLAKKIFKQKYSKFFNAVPEGLTFVFELIHPNNRIVVDYGNAEQLYLLMVRDLHTLRQWTYAEMQQFVKEYDLDITERIPFDALEGLIDIASTAQNQNKEGWVIRVVTPTEDFMFKLKYAQYFELARAKIDVSLAKVHNLLAQDLLDDFLSTASEPVQLKVQGYISNIFEIYDLARELVQKYCNEILSHFGILLTDFTEDRPRMVEIIKYVTQNYTQSAQILAVLKGQKTWDMLYERLLSSQGFNNLVDLVNKECDTNYLLTNVELVDEDE